MKKFVTVIALLLAVTLFPSKADAYENASYTSAKLDSIQVKAESKDLRVVALQNVFERYNSPLVDYADSYVQTADVYGIDWKLLPAIAGLESTFGRAMIQGTHNAYGWGSGRIYFDSWEDGIDTILGSLRTRYIDRGATTVSQIGSIYAESPTWATRVEHFMDEIADEYNRLSLERPLALAI